MAERRIINGFIVERQADGSLVTIGPAGPQPVTIGRPDPTLQYEAPKAVADLERTRTQNRIDEAMAPAEISKAMADARKAEADAAKTDQEATLRATTEQKKATRQAFRTDGILGAIREARNIARSRGGTGWSSLLSGLPETDAKALKTALDPIKGNLSFGRLQEMRDESVTGGALGSVSNIELELLASTVASLDQSVDVKTFLDRLDKIERHFIDAQLSNDGYDRNDPARRQIMRDQFGYTGVFEDEISPDRMGLAGADAQQTRTEIPDEYQREHLRYLRDNWGRIDQQDYVRFRIGLDNAYGLNPDIGAYSKAVPSFNDAAREGASPEQLGNVPAPTRDMGAIERGLNYAAQSSPGAAFASATNAFAAGLPTALGGQQGKLGMLKDAYPISSFVGDMAGSGAGALALGGGAGLLGGRAATMLGKPFGSEALHSSIYGATQDDNMLRGAAYGLGGSLAGSYVGQKIGREFPEVFAGKAVADADGSVPTVQELKEQAADLYSDVEARGIAAGPDATTEMRDRARRILASNGRIGGDGRAILQDGSTKQAYDLIDSFSGGDMLPSQANTVRETLGEGLTSSVPKERRIASMLLEDFDNWSAPVLPGAEQAREVSSRYIRGQQLENLTDRAIGRGNRLRGSDDAAQVRTMYGQLDEKIGQGQAFFDPQTSAAVSRVAQGDKITNALRWLGKFSPENVMPALGQASGAAASAATGNIVPAVAAGTMAAGGLFGRKVSNNRTLRAAAEAEMMALGGDDYRRLLDAAKEVAATRTGRALGGGLGAGLVSYSNQQR